MAPEQAVELRVAAASSVALAGDHERKREPIQDERLEAPQARPCLE